VHWLPVPASLPHRLLYTVYVPVCAESHCPQKVVALLSTVGVGVARARPARAEAKMMNFMLIMKMMMRMAVVVVWMMFAIVGSDNKQTDLLVICYAERVNVLFLSA